MACAQKIEGIGCLAIQLRVNKTNIMAVLCAGIVMKLRHVRVLHNFCTQKHHHHHGRIKRLGAFLFFHLKIESNLSNLIKTARFLRQCLLGVEC